MNNNEMKWALGRHSCVPLCHDCHQAHPVSYHRNREAMNIDWEALVRRLNGVYRGMSEYARGQE